MVLYGSGPVDCFDGFNSRLVRRQREFQSEVWCRLRMSGRSEVKDPDADLAWAEVEPPGEPGAACFFSNVVILWRKCRLFMFTVAVSAMEATSGQMMLSRNEIGVGTRRTETRQSARAAGAQVDLDAPHRCG